MAQHDPKVCEKVPFTAYYSNRNWSCEFHCPECGSVQRLNLTLLGHGEMLCDGLKIAPAPRAG